MTPGRPTKEHALAEQRLWRTRPEIEYVSSSSFFFTCTPFGGIPTYAHAWVALPAHACWPAQRSPGESMKYVRGIDTWNSNHCHSGPAAGNVTVQLSFVGPQLPLTGVPAGCHEIAPGGFVAHSAEFDP